ncbi:putative glycoside hydrolase [Peribacillus frigoritolerans]|nr:MULTISPECIES: putative glycoside hydrolase [Bacillaceae]MCP1093690.1 putative glycoside hydrolase [Bacillaceae bacterium OS4b]MCF7621375.1 putative glycoside hydrolase [Peribacillus frigoritolerans]MCP1152028.1 putative glycoside hydrolase [Peribacillus frigoritolerans]MCT1389352.1 putative glycoside hydrolase [Peribacillus frigoritolerans]MEA3575223.1 putative glycoside hydrolase [Peribacillus frigoritolerans]
MCKWLMTGICLFLIQQPVHAQGMNETRQVALENKELPASVPRFVFDSGLKFDYPDAVRGIYVTGPAAGGNKLNELINYVDETDLNAMVIDIKDDKGNVTYKTEDPDSPYAGIGKDYIKNPRAMLKKFEDKQIYPIARVVVFKDSLLAKEKPELSFLDGEKVWKNGRGEAFVNPFLKEVWDYNVGIAIEAAKMGFKEIQFDYVRFPEGFENKEDDLKYNVGEYDEAKMSHTAKRVQAVTDFVSYARKQLEPYDVEVSVDIFGYAATLPEAPGIGQNFTKISENVDVISSMIYPSHWTSYFGIEKPDLEPYNLVKEYAKLENGKLKELKTPPTSRPWLQDFTASYLGDGNYQRYGKEEVEAQIKALNDNGIDEYLLWNAANRYTKGVDYTP